MRKPIRWLIIGVCIVLLGAIGYSLKGGPVAALRYARIHVGSIFLQRGMSGPGVRLLLGNGYEVSHEWIASTPGLGPIGLVWTYRQTTPALTAHLVSHTGDGALTLADWSWDEPAPRASRSARTLGANTVTIQRSSR
jgi:hypothetical protein